MKEQTIQDIAMQKILTLSEQDAVKVLIFMTGLDAGSKLPSAENAREKAKAIGNYKTARNYLEKIYSKVRKIAKLSEAREKNFLKYPPSETLNLIKTTVHIAIFTNIYEAICYLTGVAQVKKATRNKAIDAPQKNRKCISHTIKYYL